MGILEGLKKFLNKIEEKRAIENERRARYSEIAKEGEAYGRGVRRGEIIENRRYQRWKEDRRRGNSFQRDMDRDIRRIRKNLPK